MVQPLQISTITCYAVVLPLGFLILQRATLYDGIRHVLFVIPMLAVVAGLGWRALLPFLTRAPVVTAVMAGRLSRQHRRYPCDVAPARICRDERARGRHARGLREFRARLLVGGRERSLAAARACAIRFCRS